MDKQHLVLIEMAVRGDFGAGQQRLRAYRKRGPGLAWVHLEDDVAGRGRSELEDFALSRLKYVAG